jgi:hypothetical protein
MQPVRQSDGFELALQRWHHLEINSRLQFFLDGQPLPSRWANPANTFSLRGVGGEATLYMAHRIESLWDNWRGALREVRISRGILHEGPFIPYAVRAADDRVLYWWSLGEGEGPEAWEVISDQHLELTQDTAWLSCPRAQ